MRTPHCPPENICRRFCRCARSLRDLLHRDYADFINLSTKLDGVDEQLARAVAPTKVARASCAVVQAQVCVRVEWVVGSLRFFGCVCR